MSDVLTCSVQGKKGKATTREVPTASTRPSDIPVSERPKPQAVVHSDVEPDSDQGFNSRKNRMRRRERDARHAIRASDAAAAAALVSLSTSEVALPIHGGTGLSRMSALSALTAQSSPSAVEQADIQVDQVMGEAEGLGQVLTTQPSASAVVRDDRDYIEHKMASVYQQRMRDAVSSTTALGQQGPNAMPLPTGSSAQPAQPKEVPEVFVQYDFLGRIYTAGPLVPGTSGAVERNSRFRSNANEAWMPIKPGHVMPLYSVFQEQQALRIEREHAIYGSEYLRPASLPAMPDARRVQEIVHAAAAEASRASAERVPQSTTTQESAAIPNNATAGADLASVPPVQSSLPSAVSESPSTASEIQDEYQYNYNGWSRYTAGPLIEGSQTSLDRYTHYHVNRGPWKAIPVGYRCPRYISEDEADKLEREEEEAACMERDGVKPSFTYSLVPEPSNNRPSLPCTPVRSSRDEPITESEITPSDYSQTQKEIKEAAERQRAILRRLNVSNGDPENAGISDTTKEDEDEDEEGEDEEEEEDGEGEEEEDEGEGDEGGEDKGGKGGEGEDEDGWNDDGENDDGDIGPDSQRVRGKMSSKVNTAKAGKAKVGRPTNAFLEACHKLGNEVLEDVATLAEEWSVSPETVIKNLKLDGIKSSRQETLWNLFESVESLRGSFEGLGGILLLFSSMTHWF